jgi:hypothetical protein
VHDLELDAVGVVEEERVVAGPVVVLARLAFYLGASLGEPACAFVDGRAVRSEERDVVNANGVTVERDRVRV